MLYIQEKFKTKEEIDFTIDTDQNLINFEAKIKDEILLKKRIIFVFNKRDLFNDEELLKEYKKTFLQQLNLFFEKHQLSTLDPKLFEQNSFVTSAGTYFGIGELMRSFANILQKTDFSTYDPNLYSEKIPNFFEEEDETIFVSDITEKEKPHLIENNYINPLESRFAKVWLLQHPEISKMVFTLPRGNDEAEAYFWKTMKSRGFLDFFESEGILK